jgi:hypothetical protein
MHWDLTEMSSCCYYGPVEKGIFMSLFIIFICILYHLLSNGIRYFNTKRGLRRIHASIQIAAHSDQPVQLNGIELKKSELYEPARLILNTFRDMETLKSKDNFSMQWKLRSKYLENQIKRTFFNRDPFLVFGVFSMLLGGIGFLYLLRTASVACGMTGSGGLASISGGINEFIVLLIFSLINCTVSALGFWGTKKRCNRVLTEITNLEIRLFGN